MTKYKNLIRIIVVIMKIYIALNERITKIENKLHKITGDTS